MNKRFVKNFIQAVISSICYAYAMHMWFPNIPHIVTAFVVSISITLNVIDFQKDIKKELIIGIIAVASVLMFSEVMVNASEAYWWQKENSTAVIGAIFVASLEAMIKPKAETLKIKGLKECKDVCISAMNAIAVFKTISIKLPEGYSVFITACLTIFINIDFDKKKAIRNYQIYVAMVISAISAVTTLFFKYMVFRNIYVTLAIIFPIANVVYPILLNFFTGKEPENESEDSSNEASDS